MDQTPAPPGSLAAQLMAAREGEREAIAAAKAEADKRVASASGIRDIHSRFVTVGGAVAAAEQLLRAATTGVVSIGQYRAAREASERHEQEMRVNGGAAAAAAAVAAASAKAAAAPKRKQPVLSFQGGDDDDDDDTRGGDGGSKRARGAEGGAGAGVGAGAGAGAVNVAVVPAPLPRAGGGLGKDPRVATAFLPDPVREAREAALRVSLEREWGEEQERIKGERLTVVFSYWDGTGHRRELVVTKGTTIGKFIELARQSLVTEFPELRSTSTENLLYVKEDLILPHSHTFYELIATRARGKSGPLFSFDVHEDIRERNDARVEKDESHPGKIVDRRWYAANKHVFPTSRWEVYDPAVARGAYTIHGGIVTKGAEK